MPCCRIHTMRRIWRHLKSKKLLVKVVVDMAKIGALIKNGYTKHNNDSQRNLICLQESNITLYSI